MIQSRYGTKSENKNAQRWKIKCNKKIKNVEVKKETDKALCNVLDISHRNKESTYICRRVFAYEY